MDYKVLLESLGISTRLGRCHLHLAYEYIQAQKISLYEEEFSTLAIFSEAPILKWIKTMHSKSALGEENVVIIEILTEMYKKLERLEQILTHKEQELLPLAHKAKLRFVGHDALCLDEDQSFGDYKGENAIYVRMFVPFFPERTLGIFARVLHPQVAKIEHIHIKNRTYFDTFVAECERGMILDTKSLQQKTE